MIEGGGALCSQQPVGNKLLDPGIDLIESRARRFLQSLLGFDTKSNRYYHSTIILGTTIYKTRRFTPAVRKGGNSQWQTGQTC